MIYSRDPQPLGCGLVPVCGLLGTGRTAGGEQRASYRSHYRLKHPPNPAVCEKIVFHKTGPWCQKGWGPLI